MAVTLISEPFYVSPIGNGVEFELLLDSSGNGADIVYSIGYQLFDEDDNAITDLEQMPYTSGGSPVDFAQDIAPYLYTTPIATGTNDWVYDSNFQKSFYLQYGQIEFDTATCVTETSGVNLQSSTFKVINSVFQWWESDNLAALGSGDLIILSDLPTNSDPLDSYNFIDIEVDQSIGIWVCSVSGNIYISRSNFDKDDLLLSGTEYVRSVLGSSGVYSIDLSPYGISNFSPVEQEGLYRYRVDIRYSVFEPPIAIYDFRIKQCSDANFKELQWIEPKGSVGSMVFENVTESNNAVGLTYESYTPRGQSAATYGRNYGRTRTEVKTTKVLTLTKTFPNTDDWRVYLDGLISSQSHWIKYPANGTYIVCKFILQDGQYPVDQTGETLVLTITGEVHLPVNRV